MFLPVVFVFYQSSSFLKQDIDLLQCHMAIWQATSCQLCQLRLNHRTDHMYLTTVPLLYYNIVETYKYISLVSI